MIKLDINTPIYITSEKNLCDHCNQNLETKIVRLIKNNKEEEDVLLYCVNCKEYFLNIEEKKEYLKNYSSYDLIKSTEKKTEIFDECYAEILSKYENHISCYSIFRKNVTMRCRNKYNNVTKVNFMYCENCKKILCLEWEKEDLESLFKKVHYEDKKKNIFVNGKTNIENKKNRRAGTRELVTFKTKVYPLKREMEKSRLTKFSQNCVFIERKQRIDRTYKWVNFYTDNKSKIYVDLEEIKNIIKKYEPPFNLIGKIIYEENTKELDEYSSIKLNTEKQRNRNIDFLVKTNIILCAKNKHDIYPIDAVVSVVTRIGEIKEITLRAFYCEQCKLYFILTSEYERIRKLGIPLCSIYEYNIYLQNKKNNMELKSESLIHSFGYNVNYIDDIPRIQRQQILKFIIENKIMKKSEIIYFLGIMSKSRSHLLKYKNAIQKWEEDLYYVRNLNEDIIKKEKIESIRIANYIKQA